MFGWIVYKILGPVCGGITLMVGFYTLYLTFLNGNSGVVTLRGLFGGAMILIGMFIMVKVRSRNLD
jgi:hypothetical protein